MIITDKFVAPRSGEKFSVEIRTDAINATVCLTNETDMTVVEFSRANLISFIRMLDLTLMETPLDAVEIRKGDVE